MRVPVRTHVRVYVYMHARMHGWVYACVRCGARHCVAWVVWCACIVAMQGSVRRAPTHRHALNPRAGVTMLHTETTGKRSRNGGCDARTYRLQRRSIMHTYVRARVCA